ncbi:MAG: hypothetical protein WD407_03335 [Rhodospirillales bacterium]
MQRRILLSAFLAFLVFLAAASPGTTAPARADTAEIVKRGLIECFPAGLKTKKGKARHCEASAVVYLEHQKRLIVAIDKALPKKFSPVFSLSFRSLEDTPAVETYFKHALFEKTRKIEGMTVTPDGETVFATTAFDRISCDTPKRDRYNRLLSWPARNRGAVSLVNPSERGGRKSSRPLRAVFAKALSIRQCPEPGYAKIEGLAALPGNKLLFGVREHGTSHEDFSYVVKILEADYAVKGGVPFIPAQTPRLYDAGPLSVPGGYAVGLSGIEYDKYNKRLYLLTSFETAKTDEGLGAFLWVLTLERYRAGQPPLPVRDRTGRHIMFAHKAEGLAVLDKKHIMAIHDDDRVLGRDRIDDLRTQFRREPHQAAFTIVRFD